MLENENIKVNIKKHLVHLIRNEYISDIGELDICEGMYTSLIYPTDDFFLYEYQFDAMTKLMAQNEKLYILQTDWDDAMFSGDSKLYSFDNPISYLEYRDIVLECKTLMFSSSFEWVLVIEECLEGGIGILVANCSKIEQFESFYKREKEDIVDFFEFHINDERSRKLELPIISMVAKLLKHGK